MNSEYKLSTKEMKTIAHQIINEEVFKNGVKLDVYPITVLEYFKNEIFKNKITLVKLAKRIAFVHNTLAFNDLNGKAIIFLNKFKKTRTPNESLFDFVATCYHEFRHSVQHKFQFYSYEGFLYDMDGYIHHMNSRDYDKHHNRYSYEIGANLYSIKKASEYLTKNYPDIFEKHKDKISKIEQQHIFEYMLFDASDLVDRVIKYMKRKNKNTNNIDEITPVLKVFMNDDLSFKSIKDIMQNEKYADTDIKIIYAFLSSKSFLESININELSDEELDLLIESLEYTNSVYKNQNKYIEKTLLQEKTSFIECIKSQKSILMKIVAIDNYFSKILQRRGNYTRNDRKRDKHIEIIQEYIEQGNEIVEYRGKH